MAKLITKKYKNNNKSSAAYGRWYGRFVYTETLSTEEFAQHISNHGSPFDRATILGVLMAACDCLVELVKDCRQCDESTPPFLAEPKAFVCIGFCFNT